MNEELRTRIMRRVYAIYLIKLVYRPIMLKLYALALGMWGLSALVSFGDVFENLSRLSDPSAIANFFVYALAHTELAVQTLLCAVLIAFAWLMRDIGRGESFPRMA
jgi:hypothetical protein